MHRDNLVLLRGGGDLASGVALRLHRAGFKLTITELAQPLAVRRAVSFAEAVYAGQQIVEGVTGRFVKPEQVPAVLEAGEIPVLIDPNAEILLSSFFFLVVIDARLTKQPPAPLPVAVPLHIGLGPGFHAGVNCHAVVETRRSHTLGRVYWDGSPQPDSGQPEGDPRRVLRAPGDGILVGKAKIGEHVEEGQVVAVVSNQYPVVSNQYPVASGQSPVVSGQYPVASGQYPAASGQYPAASGQYPAASGQYPAASGQYPVVSAIKGMLRGMIHDGLQVPKGLKIGDIDPRDDPSACYLVSDKALSIGGAVLEAILTKAEIREQLFNHEGHEGAQRF